MSTDQSAVEVVFHILEQAVKQSASDIHFEPNSDRLRVRFRIDGVLYDQKPVSAQQMPMVISRLKVLAHLNIAQKKLPQDGKFSDTVAGKHVDLRVSTFPSVFGQKVVVRILDREQQAIALDQLGMAPKTLEHFSRLLKKENGLLLVTGPTGSGKTTTLYAALSQLHAPEKNIVTLEDPVEYHLDGVTQGHINPDVGFTFDKGIRSVLRQDPDILMVGEIRDRETARVAVEAAMTGHLVLSTLHTNDAPSAIVRLLDMGIEPYLINAAVQGVVAQRLVRRVCGSCKQQHEMNEDERVAADKLGLRTNRISSGAGCTECHGHGLKGRVGIFEQLPITADLRAKIVQSPRFEQLSDAALAGGMTTLLQDGIQKVESGVISLDELLRVVA